MTDGYIHTSDSTLVRPGVHHREKSTMTMFTSTATKSASGLGMTTWKCDGRGRSGRGGLAVKDHSMPTTGEYYYLLEARPAHSHRYQGLERYSRSRTSQKSPVRKIPYEPCHATVKEIDSVLRRGL